MAHLKINCIYGYFVLNVVFLVFLYSFPIIMYLTYGYCMLHIPLATLRNMPRVVMRNLVTFNTSKGDEFDQNISLNHLNTTEVSSNYTVTK